MSSIKQLILGFFESMEDEMENDPKSMMWIGIMLIAFGSIVGTMVSSMFLKVIWFICCWAGISIFIYDYKLLKKKGQPTPKWYWVTAFPFYIRKRFGIEGNRRIFKVAMLSFILFMVGLFITDFQSVYKLGMEVQIMETARQELNEMMDLSRPGHPKVEACYKVIDLIHVKDNEYQATGLMINGKKLLLNIQLSKDQKALWITDVSNL